MRNEEFQSTQPSQAVTTILSKSAEDLVISIHTALAGCDGQPQFGQADALSISIHTALAGCDTFPLAISESDSRFQSTQPSQAVTRRFDTWFIPPGISIHTALAGCDAMCCAHHRPTTTFQSTQPSQAVTICMFFFISSTVFQSTQPSQAVTAIIPNKNHILTDIIIYNAYIFN